MNIVAIEEALKLKYSFEETFPLAARHILEMAGLSGGVVSNRDAALATAVETGGKPIGIDSDAFAMFRDKSGSVRAVIDANVKDPRYCIPLSGKGGDALLNGAAPTSLDAARLCLPIGSGNKTEYTLVVVPGVNETRYEEVILAWWAHNDGLSNGRKERQKITMLKASNAGSKLAATGLDNFDSGLKKLAGWKVTTASLPSGEENGE